MQANFDLGQQSHATPIPNFHLLVNCVVFTISKKASAPLFSL